MDPIRIRPAKPAVSEGRVYARRVDEAADGFFRLLLGPRYRDILAAAYIEPGHDLSYQHASFAERSGELLGMASGYTAEAHRSSSTRPLEDAPGYPAFRAAVIATLGAPILRFIDTVEEGDFYLQAIAVDARARGEGIGSRLIDRVEEHARASGSARLCLDVASSNDGARRLYERMGMTIIRASRNVPLVPRSRVFRMAKPL